MSGLALPRARRVAVRQPPRQHSAGPLALSLLGHTALLAAGLAATLLLPSTPPAPAFSPPAFSVELAIAPAQPAPADLVDIAPLPQPPPDPVVVPQPADLPAPDASPTVALPPPPPPPPRPEPRARPVVQPPAARSAAAAPGPAAAPMSQAPVAETAPMLIANPRFRVPPRPPAYPRRAVELRAEGEALIGARLDPSGAPHDVRVLRSSGHPMLDHAALAAVGGWAFEPGRRAGHPVAARVEIPVRFTLR